MAKIKERLLNGCLFGGVCGRAGKQIAYKKC
jgi:hypothetical protein